MANKVCYFALRMFKSQEDAMDIMQDSFIMAFKKIDTLNLKDMLKLKEFNIYARRDFEALPNIKGIYINGQNISGN